MRDGLAKKKERKKEKATREDRGGTYRRQVQSRRQTRLTCAYVCVRILFAFFIFFALSRVSPFFSFLPKIFSSPPPGPAVGACYKRARARAPDRYIANTGCTGERYYIYRRQLGTDLIYDQLRSARGSRPCNFAEEIARTLLN